MTVTDRYIAVLELRITNYALCYYTITDYGDYGDGARIR